MKSINIGILADKFINWGGGIDFLRLILNGLNSLNEHSVREINISVYIPNESKLKITVKNGLKVIINYVFNKNFELNSSINRDFYVKSFQSINSNIKIVFYDGNEKVLLKKNIANNVDFILPVFTPFSEKFPIRWAGYIYDFQHKYYPEFFSIEEIKERDNLFQAMLTKADTVIVNARAVQNDITKFINDSKAAIVVLPFCPVLNLNYFNSNLELSKYRIPEKYFMISNQFWKHKDHITAFRAFKQFLNNIDDKNVSLVCTGQTFDVRFPNYFNELKQLIKDLGLEDNVFILGYIPKDDQLQLLKECIGIIQPTLFEGGPGGGAIYESVAYGIPSLVSDIPVNMEIEDETVTFFKRQSVDDLARKIEELFFKKSVTYSKQYLIDKNNISLKKMGTAILNSINLN